MRRLPLILSLCCALLGAPASAQAPDEAPPEPATLAAQDPGDDDPDEEPAAAEPEMAPLEAIFSRFDHRMHARPLAREGLGCTACHQVGGKGDDRLSRRRVDEAFLPPPPGACHYCHNPPPEERDVGPGRCALCHDVVEPPPTHGAGWVEMHGREMRVGALQCEDCHRQAFCIDCHNRKERITYNVHDRTWITVHGIAARTDPGTCGTCHIQAECTECHAGKTWGGP